MADSLSDAGLLSELATRRGVVDARKPEMVDFKESERRGTGHAHAVSCEWKPKR